MVTPGAKRDAVAHARAEFGLSERRACKLLVVSALTLVRQKPRYGYTGGCMCCWSVAVMR